MTKDQTDTYSDKGRLLFQIYFPHFKLQAYGDLNWIKSPFTGKEKSFTITSFFGRYWRFTDKSLKDEAGDIYKFIALKHKLNSETEFDKILEIAEEKLLFAGLLDNPTANAVYRNKRSDDLLTLSQGLYKYLAPRQFKEYHPIFSEAHGHDMAVAKSFTYVKERKLVSYKHDWSKLDESLFSIPVNKDGYFILYNPITRQYHEWGVKNSTDIVGWKQAMYNAFVYYPDTTNTLFITNTIEGLLNFQSLAIPTIAFINKEEALPLFFHHVIRPRFPKIVLLYDETKEGKKHIDIIAHELKVQPSTLQYKVDDAWIVEPDHSAYFKSHLEKDSSLDYVFSLLGDRLPVELEDYTSIIERVK